MSTHYETLSPTSPYREVFGVELPFDATRAFHDAWIKGQRRIVPMAAFYEDDWRAGKALPTRISRIDGEPMGVAGLWASWTGPEGDTIVSFTLLRRCQQPGSEKLHARHPERRRLRRVAHRAHGKSQRVHAPILGQLASR